MTQPVWGDPEDVPAVVEQLTGLRADRPAAFHRLYLHRVTSVLDMLYEGRFVDPLFVSRLEVELATRYFDALRHFRVGNAACPRVWRVLFAEDAGPTAGVHAQIAFDLPFALVTTLEQIGSDPVDDTDQHHDYVRLIEMYPGYPRQDAWRNARRLWAVRHDLRATAKERDRLDT